VLPVTGEKYTSRHAATLREVYGFKIEDEADDFVAPLSPLNFRVAEAIRNIISVHPPNPTCDIPLTDVSDACRTFDLEIHYNTPLITGTILSLNGAFARRHSERQKPNPPKPAGAKQPWRQ
jgi:hypothetical protein